MYLRNSDSLHPLVFVPRLAPAIYHAEFVPLAFDKLDRPVYLLAVVHADVDFLNGLICFFNLIHLQLSSFSSTDIGSL